MLLKICSINYQISGLFYYANDLNEGIAHKKLYIRTAMRRILIRYIDDINENSHMIYNTNLL